MKNAYIAIGYACNESCAFCPCSGHDKKEYAFAPVESATRQIDIMAGLGAESLTVSGGEPTIHPDFFRILSHAQNRMREVTLLTNAERLGERRFADSFMEAADRERMRVITTLHGHSAEAHERANGTGGSFGKTMSGLKRIAREGIKTTVKHCLTKANYKELRH